MKTYRPLSGNADPDWETMWEKKVDNSRPSPLSQSSAFPPSSPETSYSSSEADTDALSPIPRARTASSTVLRMRLALGLCAVGGLLMLLSLPSITSMFGLSLAISILKPLCWTGVTVATTGVLLGAYSFYARPQERTTPAEDFLSSVASLGL